MEDFDFNDTAPAPLSEQEFLMENLCVKKGRAAGGYEPPPTRSAAKRWKNVNEQNMMTRLNEMHIIKKQNAHKSKEAAREIIRKIPVELLAKEWLSKEDATVDMRAYLVDQILPTLILGVERLLREVDEKGLSATNRFEPEFNPINYLAQYLMRNNPRFSNFAEASPYVRGLRQVSEEIKQELFTFEDNRLARIKAETRRKRTDRERYEQEIREGKARRHNKLISQFSDWTKYGESNTVELAVLQNALSFFLETVELLPPELQEMAKFSYPLEPTDETGKTLSVKEFAQYISLFVEDLPQQIFHLFLVHMAQCAATHNASADRDTRRIILTNLFLICDYGVLRFMIADRKLGLLDRERILTLFERFWDRVMVTRGESIGTLRNPRRWPVVEVEEVDDILFDAWLEEPDGGIRQHETDEQTKLLEAIRVQILEEGELNAAKDKAAKEKWKLEQLEQKSAGYRAKLYKYNVTDYMNLNQYPYLDTMEASIRNFDNTDGKLTMDHDLYASTLTKTERDRNKDYKDDLFNLKTVVGQDSKTNVDESEYSYRSDKLLDTPTDKHRRYSQRKKIMSSSKLASSSQPSEKKSLGQINRNNNTLGNSDSSSEDINNNTRENNDTSSEDNKERETNSRHDKMKMVLRQRRRDNRNERVSITSEESSEESDITPWPRLTFRRPSSFSSEEELRERQRVTSGLTPRSLLLTPKTNLMSETQRTPTATSPRVLPPVQMHRNVDVEQHNVAIMRDLVASQTKMLASKTYTAGRAKGTRIAEKPQSPETDHILELLKDDNKNRNVEDSNDNSCTRARVINTSSTSKAIPEFSAFQELFVNLSQFVQMFESFIGPHPDPKVFASLVSFVSDRYQDLEPDKTNQLLQARERETLAKKKAQLNTLFEKWDNDASGFLELEDVTEYMCRFKDGQEIEAIKYAQFDLKKRCQFFDGRLSKREFRDFLNMTIDELPGKETFDLFVDFLMNSVERSYGERIRGEARKKWLQQINLAARTGGTSMEPVYKSVFQALYKDAETHGGEKRISASISMLETNRLEPSRGELMLRYSACTPEDCQYMLGKPLYKNMKGVSFQAVETGKPVHIPRVAKHGNIYFWNYDRNPEVRSGSFIAIPLKDNKKRVFGVLGVDTMIDPRKDIIFTKHEIQFFQGVAKAFSIAYHYVEKKRKFLIVLERAISWFRCRCPHVLEIAVYFKEPNLKDINDYVLRKIMVMDNNGTAAHVTEVIRLEKKDNFFRRYLFDSLETSSTVIAEIHGSTHAAFPFRDINGMADGIVDLNTGKLKNLPRHESRDMQRLLRLLQRAYNELNLISLGEDPQCVLEAERDPVVAVNIMFERIMLHEVRDNICRIDPQSYIEIKGFYEPPRVIAEVLRATIAVFKVDQVGEGEYDDWDDLKNCINLELITNIKSHDPIASARLAEADKVQRYLKATFSVSFGEIAEQGSILAQQLYNWVFTCLALISYKTRESAEGEELVAAS